MTLRHEYKYHWYLSLLICIRLPLICRTKDALQIIISSWLFWNKKKTLVVTVAEFQSKKKPRAEEWLRLRAFPVVITAVWPHGDWKFYCKRTMFKIRGFTLLFVFAWVINVSCYSGKWALVVKQIGHWMIWRKTHVQNEHFQISLPVSQTSLVFVAS